MHRIANTRSDSSTPTAGQRVPRAQSPFCLHEHRISCLAPLAAPPLPRGFSVRGFNAPESERGSEVSMTSVPHLERRDLAVVTSLTHLRACRRSSLPVCSPLLPHEGYPHALQPTCPAVRPCPAAQTCPAAPLTPINMALPTVQMPRRAASNFSRSEGHSTIALHNLSPHRTPHKSHGALVTRRHLSSASVLVGIWSAL